MEFSDFITRNHQKGPHMNQRGGREREGLLLFDRILK